MKYNKRYSVESLSKGSDEDKEGLMFANSDGITDLTAVDVVGASVDTIRQLFNGLPKAEMIASLEAYSEEKETMISLSEYSDEKWHFTRMGKVGGYRYKIQNNEIGLVILFGSWYANMDKEGSHLKIEVSPHFISTRSVKEIWRYLNHEFGGISRKFLDNAKPAGVAVHLACDYQGFDLPHDFIQKLVTNSRTVRAYDGVSTIDLSDLAEAFATYGGKNQAKNYLIGKPVAVQMAIYDKSHEIIRSDKVDYFNREWNVFSLGVYDQTKVVRRIEARLHHSVVREIGLGLGLTFEGFDQVVEHLTDLWRYALERNRLMIDGNAQGYIHPFWQLLMQDVFFYVPAKGHKISRKKKLANDPIAKNIALILGNYLSIVARQGLTVKRVMAQLKLLHIYDDILVYYRRRGLDEYDLEEYVRKGLERRRIYGTAA